MQQILPKKGDLWTATGYEGGQLVYRIFKRYKNHRRSSDYNYRCFEGDHMVKYQIRNAEGRMFVRNLSVWEFLNRPVKTSGKDSYRRLAVRPLKG